MTRALFFGLSCCAVFASAMSAEPVRKPYGLEKRELWTTGKLHGTPEPPDPFRAEDAFPKLKFFEPLSAALVPGQNRFGVATRPGKLYTFPVERDVSEAKLLIDLSRKTYGLAFHPKFAENGYFFVTTIDNGPDAATGNRLLRFRVRDREQLVGDPGSEQLLLTCLARSCGSMSIDRAATSLIRSRRTIRSLTMPTLAAKSGRSVIARSGNSASTRRPVGCGPVTSGRTCGR
jgi:hypothetical protein